MDKDIVVGNHSSREEDSIVVRRTVWLHLLKEACKGLPFLERRFRHSKIVAHSAGNLQRNHYNKRLGTSTEFRAPASARLHKVLQPNQGEIEAMIP